MGLRVTGWAVTSPFGLINFLSIPSPLNGFYKWECTLNCMKYIFVACQYYRMTCLLGPIDTMASVDLLVLSHPCIPGKELHSVSVCYCFNSMCLWI